MSATGRSLTLMPFGGITFMAGIPGCLLCQIAESSTVVSELLTASEVNPPMSNLAGTGPRFTMMSRWLYYLGIGEVGNPLDRWCRYA